MAKESKLDGNHPFGAILVKDSEVILSAKNSVSTDQDPTQHAELKLASAAAKKYSKDFLKDCTLYTSTEPCCMCAGAIYWVGIRTVVFGCSAKTLGDMAGGSLVIPCNEIFSKGKNVTTVIGPINESKSKMVHLDFWKK